MTLLADLPQEHPLRNCPLEGAYHRWSIPVPFDITDSLEVVAAIKERQAAGERKFNFWKQVQSWKISKRCYNDLGEVWTDSDEWTFDNPRK